MSNDTESESEKFDILFFLYQNGGTADGLGKQLVIRNVTFDDLSEVCDFLAEPQPMHHTDHYYSLNGAIQLSRDQTRFRDTSVIKPKRFVILDEQGEPNFLHNVDYFDWDSLK